MCGIFGFVLDSFNSRPEMKRVRMLAHAMLARGSDAHGFAWVDRSGRLRSFRAHGPITLKTGLDALERLTDAVALIGHTRASTGGDPRSPINNHPHACDGGWIVHNGWFGAADCRDSAARRGLMLSSDCDTEYFARIVEDSEKRTLPERFAEAADELEGTPSNVVGLWRDRLVVMRRGNPLEYLERDGVVYFASIVADPKARPMKADGCAEYRLPTRRTRMRKVGFRKIESCDWYRSSRGSIGFPRSAGGSSAPIGRHPKRALDFWWSHMAKCFVGFDSLGTYCRADLEHRDGGKCWVIRPNPWTTKSDGTGFVYSGWKANESETAALDVAVSKADASCGFTIPPDAAKSAEERLQAALEAMDEREKERAARNDAAVPLIGADDPLPTAEPEDERDALIAEAARDLEALEIADLAERREEAARGAGLADGMRAALLNAPEPEDPKARRERRAWIRTLEKASGTEPKRRKRRKRKARKEGGAYRNLRIVRPDSK